MPESTVAGRVVAVYARLEQPARLGARRAANGEPAGVVECSGIRTGHVPTASGARAGLLVPGHGELLVAVPHRGDQRAELRVLAVRD